MNVWLLFLISVLIACGKRSPTVTETSPESGSIDGGTTIIIRGTGFEDTQAAVTVGGNNCNATVVSDFTTITCVTPAHDAGAVDVVVTNFGIASGRLTSGFTYTASTTNDTSTSTNNDTSTGNSGFRLLSDTMGWKGRSDFGVAAFNDKIWVIGGTSDGGDGCSSSTYLRDIWSSSNGATWVKEVTAAPFSGRHRHSVVVFDGKLWVISGLNVTTGCSSFYEEDVWYSPDGISWTRATADIGWDETFSGRFRWTLPYVFGTEVFLMDLSNGAGNLANAVAEIWKSANGSTWSQTTENSPMLGGTNPFSGHTYVSFLNKGWLIGGLSGGGQQNLGCNNGCIFSSINGYSWTSETTTASFGGRKYSTVFADASQLTLYGGLNTSAASLNDKWTSANGISWTGSNNSGWTPVSYQNLHGVTIGSKRFLVTNKEVWLAE